MPNESEIESRFWKELRAHPFVMLGLDGARDGHTQPMTARTEGDNGPLWFFCTTDNGIVAALGQSHRAIATFTAKGHDLFASIHGALSLVTDRATIDSLWDKQAEAWFEGGRNDPNLALLRLDAETARIWLSGSSIGAAITRLLGRDPIETARERTAEVAL